MLIKTFSIYSLLSDCQTLTLLIYFMKQYYFYNFPVLPICSFSIMTSTEAVSLSLYLKGS